MVGGTDQARTELITAGNAALERGAWEEARGCFETALREGETPQALEGLGAASYWLDDATVTIASRERAFQLYRAAGDVRSAVRVATLLPLDYFTFRGDSAVAAGWIRRARRLLQDMEPGPEHGWLALCEGQLAWDEYQYERVLEHAERAIDLGQRFDSIDMEMLGLAMRGLGLVARGDIAEGMNCLDESTAAAMAGEMKDIDAMATACCYLIVACERVRDYDRATQWCKRVEEFSRRWSFRLLSSLCRVHYADVLLWRGAWAEAEGELVLACRELETTRPPYSVEGTLRLAELRRRQGRAEEAAELFTRVESHPRTQLGLAELAFERGDARAAADSAERFLRRALPDDSTDRAAGLELLARIRSSLGDLSGALTLLAELESVAALVGTAPLRASAARARAAILNAQRDYEGARRCLEDAVDLFEGEGAPYHVALARLELAEVLSALARPREAEREAKLALTAFQQLGAAEGAARASRLIVELAGQLPEGSRLSPAPALDPGSEKARSAFGVDDAASQYGLTPRETEVARLLAQRLTDREIADALVVSPRTITTHVATILSKLGVKSRREVYAALNSA